MHTVPGLFERLTELYATGERAVEEGRLDDAIAAFTEGITLDDHFRQRYVTMYAQRAFALHHNGELEAALTDYERAIELEPPVNQAQYHFHSGMCLSALQRFEEAADAYGRSIAIHGEHPGPFHLRGKLYALELARYDEAVADFDRFLAAHSHPEVWQLRGFAKLHLGRGADAIGDLQTSKQMHADPYTDYLLAWAGAIAPDDELFYTSMQATLAAAPSYRAYFVDNDDYRRFYAEPRFRQIVGST
jgi:tetratricopeptide (TPR) repeat protein